MESAVTLTVAEVNGLSFVVLSSVGWELTETFPCVSGSVADPTTDLTCEALLLLIRLLPVKITTSSHELEPEGPEGEKDRSTGGIIPVSIVAPEPTVSVRYPGSRGTAGNVRSRDLLDSSRRNSTSDPPSLPGSRMPQSSGLLCVLVYVVFGCTEGYELAHLARFPIWPSSSRDSIRSFGLRFSARTKLTWVCRKWPLELHNERRSVFRASSRSDRGDGLRAVLIR